MLIAWLLSSCESYVELGCDVCCGVVVIAVAADRDQFLA